jgi:hypothetical protein
MRSQKSIWAKVLRVLALALALALVVYWFWCLPSQQPTPSLRVEFTP